MDDLKLTSGFKQYPLRRDELNDKHGEMWLKGFQEENGIWPYWRIHNKLYDLTDFADKHPGGKFWIKVCQGIDITEAFEASHYSENPREILKKYYVRDINTPRISPFTFEENGFFRTLRRKAAPILKGLKDKGPTFEMKLVQDTTFFLFILTTIIGALSKSFLIMSLSGFILTLAVMCSHNFFHQKDNWRMHIFDFSLFSSKEWRITHAFSHHLYSNTIYDYEIAALEPFLELLPKKSKNRFYGYLSATSLNPVFYTGVLMGYERRVRMMLKGITSFDICIFIHPVIVSCLTFLSGSLIYGILFWIVQHITFTYIFLFLTLQGVHHGKDVCHEGDKYVQNKDWGLHQVVSTAQEYGIESRNHSIFWVAIFFGDHTLHHLFPTIDHSKLHLFTGVFEETCREFGIPVPEPYDVMPMVSNYKVFYEHASRNTPYKNVPEKFSKFKELKHKD